jgi:hypothetical protein
MEERVTLLMLIWRLKGNLWRWRSSSSSSRQLEEERWLKHPSRHQYPCYQQQH